MSEKELAAWALKHAIDWAGFRWPEASDDDLLALAAKFEAWIRCDTRASDYRADKDAVAAVAQPEPLT